MIANQHDLAAWLDLDGFLNDAVSFALRMIALVRDRRGHPDRVVDEDRANEAETVVAVGHGMRIDRRRGHADSDREDERSVRHRSLKSWVAHHSLSM